ncbi:MAG: YciI family protein [Ignavibacteriales bacterium]|nr:YciI family protein [Ignavibacteriales bacterium]
MKYICLAYEEESMLNALSKDEWDVLRKETLDYVDKLKNGGYLIAAEPLQSVNNAASVRVRNGKISVTDGPFAETKETLGGFFLIEAKDLNDAIKIASKWPSARLGTIEVRPIEQGLREESRY